MQKYKGLKILFSNVFLCILVLYGASVFAETRAVTESGDKVILFEDGTYRKDNLSKVDNELKSRIKQIGNQCSASEDDIEEAYLLAVQGWRYTLPQPKSRQAAWGNPDGRTTWWYGYWENIDTNMYSSKKPKLGQSRIFIGDGQKLKGYYRNGGSPSYPTKIETILSQLR